MLSTISRHELLLEPDMIRTIVIIVMEIDQSDLDEDGGEYEDSASFSGS